MACDVTKTNIKAAIAKLAPDGVQQVSGDYALVGKNHGDPKVSQIWTTRKYWAGNIGHSTNTTDNIMFTTKEQTTTFLTENGTCEIDLVSVFGLDWAQGNNDYNVNFCNIFNVLKNVDGVAQNSSDFLKGFKPTDECPSSYIPVDPFSTCNDY